MRSPARVNLTKVSFKALPDAVAVWWYDAAKDDDYDPTDPTRPMLAFTLGVVTEVRDDYITIAQEAFEDGHLRNSVSVPRGMVIAVVRVGKIRKPKQLQ